MVEDHEKPALVEVQRRLERKFPSLQSAQVERVVGDCYRAMTGPIRDFVPLLVERQARDVLATIVAERVPQTS